VRTLIDIVCPACGASELDRYIDPSQISACACGAARQRLFATQGGSAPSVSGDECDVTIRHGLCNADGSPRRYTSKSEIAREAARRGLRNDVTHVTNPNAGSDRNPHTQRWV
jgi:hypothetical protein